MTTPTRRRTDRDWWMWALARYGRLIARAVAAVFRRAARRLFAGLDRSSRWTVVHEAMRRLHPQAWLPQIRAAVRPPVGLAVRAAAEDERRRHAPGSGVAVIDAISREARRARGDLVAGVAWANAFPTLRRDVATTLRAGLVGGSVASAVARTRVLFGRRKLYTRTARIGHAEGQASVGAGKEAARVVLHRAGYVDTKTWHAVGDERTRDAHLHADRQAVPVGATFEVGGERCQFPGDPVLSPWNRVNCRCWTTVSRAGARRAANP